MNSFPKTFPFDIAYQGRLSLAQASVQSHAMEATLSKWAPYAQLSSVLENVDFDAAFRKSWLAMGAPADVLTNFDEMIEDRKKNQQLQEAADQAAIAKDGAKALKDASGKPDEGSVAESMINQGELNGQ